MKKILSFGAKLAGLTLVIFLAVPASAQWSDVPAGVTPSVCPPSVPGCNTPLNVGNLSQTKTGGLSIQGNVTVGGGSAPQVYLAGGGSLKVGVSYQYAYSILTGTSESGMSPVSSYIVPTTAARSASLVLSVPSTLTTVKIYRKASDETSWRLLGSTSGIISIPYMDSGATVGTIVVPPAEAGILTVNNKLVLPSGAGFGKVLTSDYTGNASWQTPSTAIGGFWIKKDTTTQGNATIIPSSGISKVEITGEQTTTGPNAYLPALFVKGPVSAGSAAEFFGQGSGAGIFAHAEGTNGVGLAAIGGSGTTPGEAYGAKLISGKFGAYLKGAIGLYSADMKHASVESGTRDPSGKLLDNRAPLSLINSSVQYAGYFDGNLVSTGKVGAGTNNPTAILDVKQTVMSDALSGEPLIKFANPENKVRGELGKWSGGALLYSDYAGGVGVSGTVSVGSRDSNNTPSTAIMGMASAPGAYSGRFIGYHGLFTRGDRYGLYATNQAGANEPTSNFLSLVNSSGKSYAAYFADAVKNGNSYAGYFDGRLATNNSLEVVGHLYLGSSTATDGADVILQNALGNYNIDNYNGTLRFHSGGVERFTFSQDGRIRISGGAPGANKLLVSNDASGNAVWKSLSEICPNCSTGPTNNYWTLSGTNLSNNSGSSLTLNVGGGSNNAKIKTTGDAAYLVLEDRNGSAEISNWGGTLTLGGSASSPIIFRNGGYVEKMRIESNGNVGIGTTNPTAKLHINGSLRLVDGTQGAGKVLTSDASGNASWQPLKEKVFLSTSNIVRTKTGDRWFNLIADCSSATDVVLSCNAWLADCEESDCGYHGTKIINHNGIPACEAWFDADGPDEGRPMTDAQVQATCLK